MRRFPVSARRVAAIELLPSRNQGAAQDQSRNGIPRHAFLISRRRLAFHFAQRLVTCNRRYLFGRASGFRPYATHWNRTNSPQPTLAPYRLRLIQSSNWLKLMWWGNVTPAEPGFDHVC